MFKKQIIIIFLLMIIAAAFGYFIGTKKFQGEFTATPEKGFLGFKIEPVDWTNPAEPRQSLPVTEKEIPKEAMRIGMTAEGFEPQTFEVKAGQKIVLAVSSLDNFVHVFKFNAVEMSKVALGLASHETRLISFYAPKDAGEYSFYCDVPGHEARGEKGVMIVK